MPTLLDLFCGVGGAAMGYHLAGFDKIIGVDNKPQPNYPFEFVLADAMTFPLDGFDLIHASPPCQRFARSRHLGKTRGYKRSEVDLLQPTLDRLTGFPLYVVENVPDAPIGESVVLCGSMFGLNVRRHRRFRCSFFFPVPLCNHKKQGRPVGVYHRMKDSIPHGGRTANTLEEGQQAMGMDWAPWDELKEAVPPAYTEYIGKQILEQLSQKGPLRAY